jgi:hypothetical protein
MAYFIRNNPHHTTIEPRENSVHGFYGGGPYHDSNIGMVRTSWKVKDNTYGTHDHKEPTHWSSGSGTVQEQPLIARRLDIASNGTVNLDVIDTFWMSRRLADPFSWSTSDTFYANMGNQVNRVDTEALLKLAGKRDGARAQLGASLLEAGKTLDMLAGATIPPVKALLRLRKGDIRGAATVLGITPGNIKRAIPNKWLEWQYGWKPMLQDIHYINQKLQKDFAKPMRLTVHHSRELTETSGDGVSYNRTLRGKSGIGITCDFKPSGLSDLDADGLLNPLSVSWELVPFSFVVDWFIPLGNTFQALTATADLLFVNGYRNSRIDDLFTQYDNGGPGQQVQQRGQYTVSRMGFNRIPMGGFPMPKLYANTNPFSTPRILNAAALVTQLLTGR